jgi:diguanylate cyclase (GGDEF)-like protein
VQDIDPRTIAYVASAIGLLLTGLMAVYWATRRSYPGFSFWVASLILTTVALSAVTWRDAVPVWVGGFGVNLVSIAAMVCIVEGARRFFDQPTVDYWTYAIALIGLIWIVWLESSDVVRPLRAVVGATTVGLLALRAAMFFMSDVRDAIRIPARACAVILLVFGLARLWRAAFFVEAAADYDILDQQLPAVLNYTFNAGFVALWAFAFFLLNASRVEADLRDSREELRLLAATDVLTQTLNRRALFERADAEVARARRYQHPLTLLIMDVDHFKSVNDEHGHPVGDEVLATIAAVLQPGVRATDQVGRIGGEEFAVLLVETPMDEAEQTAERLRQVIETTTVRHAEQTVGVTASFGLAALQAEDDFAELFRRADVALYAAKDAGRNCVRQG